MSITFDPSNKLIILSTDNVSAEEIWSRWCDWAATGDNGKYDAVMAHVGGDGLGGALSIPHYIFLLNGWRVRPMEADHTLHINGNLFTDDGSTPVVRTVGNYNVAVQYTVPVQAQAINVHAGTTSTEINCALDEIKRMIDDTQALLLTV